MRRTFPSTSASAARRASASAARAVAACAVIMCAVVAGSAVAAAPAALLAAPAAESQGVVRRDGRAMTWTMTYRLPAAAPAPAPGPTPASTTGTTPSAVPVPSAPVLKVPMRWVAYGGTRDATRLRRLAAGDAVLPVRSGVVTFQRRVRVPTAAPMSGGFCAQFDLTALGITEPATTCPTGPTATRDQLPARVPEVTVISDSVGSGLDYISGGRAKATGPWSAVFDLKVCRRLVAPPCPPNPPSALSVIQSMPGSVGDIVVMHVGYNDWGAVYDIGRLMTAMKARGVRRVVWLNLQAGAPSAPGVNGAIRAAAGRYRWLQVADWASFSAGHSWFVGDGDHVTPSGAEGLAGFYRAEIARAIAALQDQDGSPAR